jgi:hypothetical protein
MNDFMQKKKMYAFQDMESWHERGLCWSNHLMGQIRNAISSNLCKYFEAHIEKICMYIFEYAPHYLYWVRE